MFVDATSDVKVKDFLMRIEKIVLRFRKGTTLALKTDAVL